MTAADLLTLIEERAPRLRKAGVLMLKLAEPGVEFHLAPEVPDVFDPAPTKGARASEPAKDPLFDRMTYGLPDGAKLPGFEPPYDEDNAEDVDEHGRPLGADLDED